MSLTVKNTSGDTPIVTLFGQLRDGTYAAKTMREDDVPYSQYWENGIDQVMVYIAPDEEQLLAIVRALNEGRLNYSTLQQFGTAEGGTSTLPV